MGQRGELWVAVQLLLFIIFAIVPRIGPLWPFEDEIRLVGWFLTLAGIVILGWSALKLGHSLTPFPKPLATGKLVTTGTYQFVRHPIYFGVLLAACGISLFTYSPLRLLLTLMLFIFFDRKAQREEEWLAQKYPSYDTYKRKVKKIIPYVY